MALRNKVESEKHVRDTRRVKRRNKNDSVFAWPYGLRENAENALLL